MRRPSEAWLEQAFAYQLPLAVFDGQTRLWTNTLLFPVYCAALSALVLLVTAIRSTSGKSESLTRLETDLEHEEHDWDNSRGSRLHFLSRQIQSLGGVTILGYRLVQLLVVLALLGLSVPAVAHRVSVHEDLNVVVAYALCALYTYLAVLGLLAVFAPIQMRQRAFAHVSLVLAVTWGVYVYRDIWPLATLTESPVDLAEGNLLWVKIGMLSLGGVIVPLLTPRKYTPLQTKSLQESIPPAPEQTASLLSLLLYGYLEPIVWRAWRIPRLTYEMLPPLPDYDHLAVLRAQSFPFLDPLQVKSRRNITLGVLRIFGVQLCQMAVLDFVMTVGSFAPPVAVNQLLSYMEKDQTNAEIRPWFWIALFFFGSTVRDVLIQWLTFCETRIGIRIEAIITDLVFEHALRIRMKAETAESDDGGSGDATASEGTAVGSSESRTATPQQSEADERTEAGTPDSAAAKGKGKSTQDSEPASVGGAKPNPGRGGIEGKGGSAHLIGRINNLVSGDLRAINDFAMITIYFGMELPVHLIFAAVFLYKVLGWSAIVGIVAMACSLPLPGYLAKKVKGIQAEKMKHTDARVQSVSEVMYVIRMVKLFGWENRTAAQLDEKRQAELVLVRRAKILTSFITLCNYAVPYFIMLLTYFTYTVIMKQELTAAVVFSSMTVFDMLRRAMQSFFIVLPMATQASVSLNRISDFLWNTELIDEFAGSKDSEGADIRSAIVPEDRQGVIGIRNASFTWSNDTTASGAQGGARRRRFVLTVEDELLFQREKVNLIVGPTGSGKTSLLMALLGELHYIPAGSDSFVGLPREGGVAYAAQESWVQNDTIRNNILFGAPYDEVRYNKVLEQCALTRDLKLFEAEDQTEVGEKGITLSGGQKARITLARAVYSSADILLLDDILAALDVHTSKWIVERCLKGDFLRGRTIILVTHNIALVSPIADWIVDVGSDGRILSQESLDAVLERDTHLVKELKEEREELEKTEQEVDSEKPAAEAKQAAGKLVVAEEMEVGHVGWRALKLFIGNTSSRPVLFWAIYAFSQVTHHSLMNVQAWYLGHWASQYETHPASEISLRHYLTVYTATIVVSMIIAIFFITWYLYGSIRASRIVHQKLVRSVLGTTLRWLDRTPTSRIVTRCTEDIQTVDDGISMSTQMLIERTIYVLLKVLAVVLFSPIFLAPSVVVAALGVFLGNVYMKGQLSTKRELSNAKAPVLGHFGAAISGITSIRAYGAQEAFKKELSIRVNKYSRVAIMHENFNRWISARMDFIGTVFATSLAAYLVYASRLGASDTGFSLNMATAFSGMIFGVVRIFNMFEIHGNSLERIQQYLSVEQEPKPSPDGVPPAYWPASGHLVVENLSARYSPDGPEVLHDISFEIAPGERVGIVGRTGSGKSSLTLALLRCILTEGSVRYDGLDIAKLNLDALRSNITIIPQVPELLSGTLRQNLDPFSEHDDAVLNDALRAAGLFNLQEEGDKSRITLDTEVAGGGSNLSVGQRQILALARAIVRRSKLLILDEATSAIDYETDTIIQTSLRSELGKDVTLLTVAHRLQTIMDADKIMVLDAGRVVEFGKPDELLRNDKGMFRALVDESGDREKLYEMARGASSS